MFSLEEFSFPDVTADEVLVEPIYGCWEGNMTHAIHRDPVDVCRLRREARVVLGNAGVVRVLRTGPDVRDFREGDRAIVLAIASTDEFGYLTKVMAYDGAHTMGVLAKRSKMRASHLVKVPDDSYSSMQWAAFSLRYVAAWANWKVAYGCWRIQMPEHLMPAPFVLAWGGGVGFAEATLAKFVGGRALMVASTDERLRYLEAAGIVPIDRRGFPQLDYDPDRYENDRNYRRAYLSSESAFLAVVRERTDGLGASIIVDHIGRPVFRASLRALARQGVLTTAGWKCGMDLAYARAPECVQRHIHVMTHGSSRAEAVAATHFAVETGWLPVQVDEVYPWESIGTLSDDFHHGRVRTYFPLFEVNPE